MVLGGIAPAPLEVEAAERALVGGALDDERMSAAAEACYLRARPLDNTDHLMNYRKQMARPFVAARARRASVRLKTSSKLQVEVQG